MRFCVFACSLRTNRSSEPLKNADVSTEAKAFDSVAMDAPATNGNRRCKSRATVGCMGLFNANLGSILALKRNRSTNAAHLGSLIKNRNVIAAVLIQSNSMLGHSVSLGNAVFPEATALALLVDLVAGLSGLDAATGNLKRLAGNERRTLIQIVPALGQLLQFRSESG
ncbi:MAG: hypothetical protein JWN34_5317 [Bryobacterales bacterium]|nr:hypothetical protein [Bryobacterales bacterium]